MQAPFLIIILVFVILVIGIFGIATAEWQNLMDLGHQLKSSLIVSGKAGFNEVDLEAMASRLNVVDKEPRNLYLNKVAAENIVRQYITENLKLDGSLLATADSFIDDMSNPLIIDELTIYNPDDIGANTKSSTGKDIDYTTIHIRVQVPTTSRFFNYLPMQVYVNADTFLVSDQE